jgi:MFS family permease
MEDSPLDKVNWNKEHNKIFLIVSMSFLLDGVMFSIVPLLLYIILPLELTTIVFSINLIAFTLGSLILGRLADIVGRRIMFIISLLLYLVSGIFLAVFHEDFILILVLTSLINFGIGGEIGAAYSVVAEIIPAKYRGRALLLSTNFWNIGAALIAGLGLIYSALSQDVSTQVTGVLFAAVIMAIIVTIARLHLPESPRWLVQKNKLQEAINVVEKITKIKINKLNLSIEKGIGLLEAFKKYKFRLIVLLVTQTVQILTYNMIAYYLGYANDFIYGTVITPQIIFIANLGASLGAFLLLPLIDRSRRVSILLSFSLGTLSSILIYLTYGLQLYIFLLSIFINMIFSEFSWGSLVPLESELFPTGVRASVVGFISAFSNILTSFIIYLESYMNSQTYLLLTISLWFIGFLVSILWYFKGIESARKILEQLI